MSYEKKNFASLALKPGQGPRGVKIFKAWCPKPLLVGSHRPHCSLHGWMGGVRGAFLAFYMGVSVAKVREKP